MINDTIDNVIFDDDEPIVSSQQEPTTEPVVNEDDITADVLRVKGISDPSKIKFEDEGGNIIERSWDSLSREEQIEILTQSEPSSDFDILDDEKALLEDIRKSGLSVKDYFQSLVPSQPKSYRVDDLDDDDVYALHLISTVGNDITDEEIEQAINNAKQNEALYKKTVDGLRAEQIRLEQDNEARQAMELQAQQEAQYQQFANSIQDQIGKLNSFAGQDLELSAEDSDDLAAFMLDLDENGMSAFGRALQDPQLFTKAAFWLLNEDEIVSELTKQIQDSYNRGYEAGKKEQDKVVVTPKVAKKEDNDIFVDDDEW